MSKKKNFIDEGLLPSTLIGDILGSMNSKKLAAKYPIFNIQNKEAKEKLEEWAFKNNFHLQMKKTFFATSKFSGVYWVLTQINNEWIPVVTRKVTMVTRDTGDNILSGYVYARVIKGVNRNFWLYEYHNEEGIRRLVKSTPGDFEGDHNEAFNVGQDTNTTELYMETKFLIKDFVNTKGIKTIFYIPNIINVDSDGNLKYVSDRAYAKSDIDLLDEAWKNLKYTLRFARPRLVIRKEYGAEVVGADGSKYSEDEADDYLSGGSIVINSSMNLSDEGQGGVNAFIPNPQVLDSARKEYKEAFVGVLTRAGYAGNDDADGAQKSEVEIAQIRDSEFSSMEDKISLFQNVSRKWLISLGELLGLEVDKGDGIDIQRLDVREQMEMVDNLVKAVDAGFEEMDNAIARYKGISKTEAKAMLKRIQKEKEKNMEKVMTKTEEVNNEPDQVEPQVTENENAKTE